MPYNVQLPNGITVEDIPDDVSHEQARKMILEKFGVRPSSTLKALQQLKIEPLII